MLLSEIVALSRNITETQSRIEKIGLLSACLRRLAPDEIEVGVNYLAGRPRQRNVGIGPALLDAASPGRSAERATLTLLQVDEAFARMTRTTGAGSASERRRVLAELMETATTDEQRFLGRLALGELRQGALEGIM
ncbi:MAG: ATP-dependent DNA ligase, partial [Nitrospiraceae bacterium]